MLQVRALPFALFLTVLALTVPAVAQTTTRITTGSTDWDSPSIDLRGKSLIYMKGNDVLLYQVGKGWSTPIACNADSAEISAGGRFVVYASGGDPLGTNTDGNTEIFVYDRSRRKTIQITSTTGVTTSDTPTTDKRGRVIAFLSDADLVGTNADGNTELFLYNTATALFTQVTSTTLASVNNPRISINGTHVYFDSDGDLTGSNADGNKEIFRYNIQAAALAQLTNTTNGDSQRPFPSRAGRYVVFESSSNELSGANTDGLEEIYRLDTVSSTFLRLTDSAVASNKPGISGNGKAVTFQSAGDLLGTNADGSTEVFGVAIGTGGATTLSQITSGAIGTQSRRAVCNNGGTRIFFQSDADLTGAGAGNVHIFLYQP